MTAVLFLFSFFNTKIHNCIHFIFISQLSNEWCAIKCVRMMDVGAQGATSVSPADTSNEAAPALSRAISSMGEKSLSLIKQSSNSERI